MTGPPLTPEAVRQAYEPLGLLANAPEMTRGHYDFVARLYASEGVTQHELARAIVTVMKTSTFFPAPAELLERVQELREVAQREARARERAVAEAARPLRIPQGYGPQIKSAYVPPHERDFTDTEERGGKPRRML